MTWILKDDYQVRFVVPLTNTIEIPEGNQFTSKKPAGKGCKLLFSINYLITNSLDIILINLTINI
jgi:hypothetical protein